MTIKKNKKIQFIKPVLNKLKWTVSIVCYYINQKIKKKIK